MKKQAYIAPATEVRKIKLQNMIASSPGPQHVYSNSADGIDDESKILSRQSNNLWDDEE
ncbi:MAG: hypothetical protein IJ887_13435 [Prevotella sp.]|nr:hypothetical protein [Prevotella sp.]